MSPMPPHFLLEQGGLVGPAGSRSRSRRASARSAARRPGSSSRPASASARASGSPGATSTAAAAGRYLGIAGAVVDTIGKPRASASVRTMPNLPAATAGRTGRPAHRRPPRPRTTVRRSARPDPRGLPRRSSAGCRRRRRGPLTNRRIRHASGGRRSGPAPRQHRMALARRQGSDRQQGRRVPVARGRRSGVGARVTTPSRLSGTP